MTTIAYARGVIASDSQLSSSGGLRCGLVRKIARSPSGHIGGFSGSFEHCEHFLEWIERGCEGDLDPTSDEVDGFVVTPDEKVLWWQNGRVYPTMLADFHVVGTGARIALGAMVAGADPVRAVEIAIEWDVWSGGPVQVLRR